MPTSSFTKFEQFVTDVANGDHSGCLTADTDTLRVYLSNQLPVPATDTDYDGTSGTTGPAEIANGNGYTTGGEDTTNVATESGGTISVAGTDVNIAASGGSIAEFRYVVLYNDEAGAGVNLIGYWDYGSALTLLDGQSLDITFGGGNGNLFTIG